MKRTYKLISMRHLPTWRTVLLMALGLFLIGLTSVPGAQTSTDEFVNSRAFLVLVLASAALSYALVASLFWRFFIIIYEMVRKSKQPLIEYVDEDAIVTIRANLKDPRLKALSNTQLKEYTRLASDDSSMSPTFHSTTARRLDEKKLLKNLQTAGIAIDAKQLDELMSAEFAYLRQIGLVQA